IRRVPIAMSALALALASLGNLLGAYSPALRLTCGLVAGGLVLLVVLRIATDYPTVAAELRTPAALAVLPALFMALMQLATYIKPFASGVATVLWGAAVALQLLVTALFIWRFVFSFKLVQVLPSWFLIFVGYVVASVTSPAFAMEPLGRVLLYTGLVGYAVALSLVVYRMIKAGELPDPARATIAIFAAPPSLSIVGYLAVAEVRQPVVVYVLLALSIGSLLYVFSRLPGVLKLPFYPSAAALTFPMVITAIAFKQAGTFLAKTDSPIPALGVLAPAMLAIAAVMVLYVLVRYAIFLGAPFVAAPRAAVEAE
ncbi:MAG: TDT family transporter, partial [Coriobacteriia bacterium]